MEDSRMRIKKMKWAGLAATVAVAALNARGVLV